MTKTTTRNTDKKDKGEPSAARAPEQPDEALGLWMHQNPESRKTFPSLSDDQLTSLHALISYISERSGHTEFRIERRLSDRFNIPNPKCLPANDYDDAVRYLTDILPS